MTEPVFVAPRSLEEALGQHAPEGALALAGGTALTVLLRSRLVEASTLVYLGNVPELGSIHHEGGTLRLGGGVTYRQLARSDEVAAVAPELGVVAGRIANPRVRSVATLGGALVHADPRQDLPTVLLALGATVVLARPGSTRVVPLEGFARGLMDTAVAPDELVVGIEVPGMPGRRLAYERFTPASEDDFPTVAVAVAARRDDVGRVTDLRIAVGASSPVAYLAPGASALLGVEEPAQGDLEALAASAATAAAPTADRHGSVAYKQEMVRLHALRALRRALS